MSTKPRMTFETRKRYIFKRYVWFLWRLSNGHSVLRDSPWYHKLININGIAWNYKDKSYWFQFRRTHITVNPCRK